MVSDCRRKSKNLPKWFNFNPLLGDCLENTFQKVFITFRDQPVRFDKILISCPI